MPDTDRFRVPPEQLRWVLDPETLGIESTNDVASCVITPGQSRAVRALHFGLGLRSSGYNVFISGDAGTHRTETLDTMLAAVADPNFLAEDLVYVNNFKEPDRPTLLRFPAGEGARFRTVMEDAVTRLQDGVPKLLASDVYAKRRKARIKRFSNRMEEAAAELKLKSEPAGLSLVQIQMGEHSEAELLPLINDEPVTFEDLEAMVERDEFPKPAARALVEARDALTESLDTFNRIANDLAYSAGEELQELDRQTTRPFLNMLLSHVHQKFTANASVLDYLKGVEAYLETRTDVFRDADSDDESEDEDMLEVTRRLSVNLVLDNSDVTKRPVVGEPNPTVANLRGTIDREVRPGGRVLTDFTLVKAGSILRAHGGYLILHADDLEGEGQAVWSLIKRTLRTGQLRIEIESGDAIPARSLRPEPISVDVKVIIIGNPELYHALLEADSDFPKLFKVKAEFDSEMELTAQSLDEYACLIRNVVDADGLPPCTADGVAAVVEWGVRMAGQRNRITTRFSQIEDLVREGAFWSRHRAGDRITSDDVHQALDERRNRVNLTEERTQRLIREGVILISTEGERVGQVNGLTVIDMGDHRFGRPVRITSSVAVGTAGIVNIERRAALSGSHHDKGLLILTGFLQETFAQAHPLAVSASITLEQSYSEVDGDSATLAEILTVLSSLADVPLTQSLAVTGSMNQRGDIQPVGGVNEKIEGFFDLCAARDLDGTQGIVLPVSNLPNLMLRPAVVQAVRDGLFRVHAVDRLEQAVEILTGMAAGERGPDGSFPEDTVFGRVDRRLVEMSDVAREFLPWQS